MVFSLITSSAERKNIIDDSWYLFSGLPNNEKIPSLHYELLDLFLTKETVSTVQRGLGNLDILLRPEAN
jgi:hypothetical protein